VNINGINVESVTRIPSLISLAKSSDVSTLANSVNNLLTQMGTGTLATVAKNVIAAINELRTTITGIGTRIGTAERNITTLEDKGDGINGSRTLAVPAGGTSYVQLGTSSSYIILVNANALDNSLRGAYLAGVNADKHIGIKAINTASNVEIIDAGSVAGNYTGVMRIRNNGGTSLRVTIITTFGTAA
jgi:Flp pilus assembly pilin Flp